MAADVAASCKVAFYRRVPARGTPTMAADVAALCKVAFYHRVPARGTPTMDDLASLAEPQGEDKLWTILVARGELLSGVGFYEVS